ncbi:hypothetical protein BIV25_39280 [Streptomyces sp. MUSC 14]|uniref:hypothetical protein n=1 Tax=Streptomyces sp. MUSC 14 TaxID=1354889 RepID=UPI0008F5B751|nr:hypothetical protein [Streptomyces sp. MUSC 14]OIJ87269.1 hypothetical protein BIV25_39280 [Streptomyces sp. MUSC 14]
MKRKGIIQRAAVASASIVGSATLNTGLSGTAQAASCVNPGGVTPALDLRANGSDVGYLYLGYSSFARAVAHAEV